MPMSEDEQLKQWLAAKQARTAADPNANRTIEGVDYRRYASGSSQPSGPMATFQLPARPAYNPSSNVNDQIRSNRDFATGQGDRLNLDAEQRANVARQGRGAYQAYGDEVYDPLIGNRGGYSEAEQAMMLDGRDYAASDQDLEGNYLTPDESNAIQGSPWDRAAYFDSDSDMARQYESSGRQRGAVERMGEELSGAVTPDLALDEGYRRSQEGTIAGTASRIRGAVDPTRLRASEAALNDIRMSPEEQNRMITGAGMAAGTGYRAAADDVTRRAKAAGMSPMGVAAARSRLENDSAVARGDAMTNARIYAGAAKAGRAGQAEGMRMSGEESAADRVGRAESTAGGFEYDARAGLENQRGAAVRDISNRRMDVAGRTGAARVGTEADTAARETASRQFNTAMGTEIATGIERDAATRAAAVAGNRQDTAQANQATKFGQRTAASQDRFGRAQAIGNARRQDAAEGRGYLQTQMAGARADEQADYDRQTRLYGTQGGLNAEATAAQQRKDQAPKLWEKIAGIAVGAAGAAGSLGMGKKKG